MPSIHEFSPAEFWNKAVISSRTGCWEWTASKTGTRYGKTHINGKEFSAHRISFYIFFGIDPMGKCVCHKCDNPLCINPNHLFLGTYKDNIVDMISKGRDTMIGERNSMAKLTEKNVLSIREQYSIGGVTYKQLAIKHGVSITVIHQVVKGEIWSHVSTDKCTINNRCSGSSHFKAKMTEKQVMEILSKYKKGETLQKDLAKEYGVGVTTINSIITRQRWKHLSYNSHQNL